MGGIRKGSYFLTQHSIIETIDKKKIGGIRQIGRRGDIGADTLFH